MRKQTQSRRQRGATLALTAFLLTALLGMAALAVDQGVLYLARERAQNVADAAALAGGALLPNVASATAAANGVIAANNASSGLFVVNGITSPATVTRDDGAALAVGTGNSLLVQGHVSAPMAFGAAVGFHPVSQEGNFDTVSAAAQAAVVLQATCGLPAGVGIAPFALIGDDPNNADPTARYVSMLLSSTQGAQTPQTGTYQPTTTYGGQPLVLRLNVWNSGGSLTSAGNFDPVLLTGESSYLSGINSVSAAPLAAGQSLPVQTSAAIRTTQQYLAARLSSTNAQFTHDDTASPAYVNWFFGNQSLPIDTSQPPVTDPNTGATYYYRVDPHRQELTDAHVLILPVISQSVKNGTGPVTTLAFAAFFVEEPYLQSGTNAIAQGRFIGLSLPGSSGGGCTGAGIDTPPQLVE